MYIAIDFDGTVVTHEYPRIGRDIGAIPVLKCLQENGHKLILCTMRSGDFLTEAVKYLIDNGVNLYGANKNPSQSSWTKSPKIYANLYIDDAALGCPLKQDNPSERPYVYWEKVAEQLLSMELITETQYKSLNF